MFKFKPQQGRFKFFLNSMKKSFLYSILRCVILVAFYTQAVEGQTTNVDRFTTCVPENKLLSPLWKQIKKEDFDSWLEKDQIIWLQVHTLKTTFNRPTLPEVDEIVEFLRTCVAVAKVERLKVALSDEIKLSNPYTYNEQLKSAAAERNISVETFSKLIFIFDKEDSVNKNNAAGLGIPQTLVTWALDAGNCGFADLESTFNSYAEDLGIIEKTSSRVKTINCPKLAYWRAIYHGKSEHVAMQAEQTEIMKQQTKDLNQQTDQIRQLQNKLEEQGIR